MSAFLACWGVLNEESSCPTFSIYTFLRNFVTRYFRLTPVYIYVLFFYMTLFPFMGSGPFYDRIQGFEFRDEECKNWISNIFYLNNLIPYGVNGGIRGCAGWTWYLSNDMQFFLLVTPSVFYYLYFYRNLENSKGFFKSVILYAIPISLVIIQMSTTFYTMKHWQILGNFDDNFNIHLYVKP